MVERRCMVDLRGKNAVVTGGSRGIGLAITRALCRAGAEVLIFYQSDSSSAEQCVREVNEEADGIVEAVCCDVRDRIAVRQALTEWGKRRGGIDFLVNNAGINHPADFDKITDEDWDDILAVNLKGPFICCQEVLPWMKKKRSGVIVNIGSVSGQYGGPRTAHYAVSKAGLISLGQVVARFGAADNVRCNTIAAGLIASDMAASGMQSPSVQKAAEDILLRRMGSTEEVAEVVVFLVSDAASYITGQTINVNGGLYF